MSCLSGLFINSTIFGCVQCTSELECATQMQNKSCVCSVDSVTRLVALQDFLWILLKCSHRWYIWMILNGLSSLDRTPKSAQSHPPAQVSWKLFPPLFSVRFLQTGQLEKSGYWVGMVVKRHKIKVLYKVHFESSQTILLMPQNQDINPLYALFGFEQWSWHHVTNETWQVY